MYDKEKWPTKDLRQNEDKDEEADVEEIQRGEATAAYFSEIESKIKSEDFRIESVIDPKRFSNFYKLFRTTAYVPRFIENCRNKLGQESPDITTKEINKARLLSVKQIQTLLVTDSKFEKTKTNLGIFVDEEGIYRCGGKLHKVSLSFECKHPAIIPNNYHITELIIKGSHNKVYHSGIKETLTQVRSQYWIKRGRQAVKKIIWACIACKRLEGISYQSPPTAPLLDFRVNKERPFQYTGIDYFGPV